MSSPYHQAELHLISRSRIVPAGYPTREDQSGGNNADPSFVDKLVSRPDLSHHAERGMLPPALGRADAMDRMPWIECRTTSCVQVGAAVMDFSGRYPHPHQAPEQALERCTNEQTHAASRALIDQSYGS
jgi:hypothetical protein